MLRSKQLTKIIKSLPKYSYSKFILENPVRNKLDRQNAVIEAKNTFEQYTNKTIECYLDKVSDIVVLNNDYNYNYLIAFSVLCMTTTCFCSCYICCV